MHDTLLEDDRILVNQLVPAPMPIHRGDVVVFVDPGGWLPTIVQEDKAPLYEFLDNVMTFVGLAASDSDQHIIKRVIGVAGDRVICCDADGRITVNGVALDEDYIKIPVGESRASATDFDVTVPENSLWVLGDNRYNSADSRFHSSTPLKGFVPVDGVVGHAFIITWPFDRFGIIDSHGDVFAEIPNP